MWNEDYHNNPYYDPADCGLEIVAQADYSSGSYEFDYRVVWKDIETGKYYMARDSGCSCPTPFEDYTKLSDLEPFDYKTIRDEVYSEVGGDYSDLSASDARDFLNKIRRLG